MSVLIKGMEMPTSCRECKAIVCYGFCGYCGITKNGARLEGRNADCPLVELPPHGRLIDADAVQETVLKLIEDGWDISRNDYKRMDNILYECPTIIEAEDENNG